MYITKQKYTFQFHLVRLKANEEGNDFIITVFQFHLVRLKESK